MFTKIAPQHAQESSGFSVFIIDREHVGYRDAEVEARLEADLLCTVVPLYVGSLQIKGAGKAHDPNAIVKKIQEGLSYLGVKHELAE